MRRKKKKLLLEIFTFIFCAERWGRFVDFDLHLSNYREMNASEPEESVRLTLVQKLAAGDPAA
jgi:hypothetical protein